MGWGAEMQNRTTHTGPAPLGKLCTGRPCDLREICALLSQVPEAHYPAEAEKDELKVLVIPDL